MGVSGGEGEAQGLELSVPVEEWEGEVVPVRLGVREGKRDTLAPTLGEPEEDREATQELEALGVLSLEAVPPPPLPLP